jgi:hypothetical protein
MAVQLAKAAELEDNPVVEVLVVVRFEDGYLDCTWSPMDTKELAEMKLYAETEITQDIYRVWHEGEEEV